MIKIFIQGLKDGEYPIELSVQVDKIKEFYSEFIGEIKFYGNIKIIGKRYTINGIAECNSRLECDYSLKEFEELIKCEIHCTYFANTEMYFDRKNKDDDDSIEKIIHEDDKYIDITDEICEELFVNLPMKRIAPEFRDKDFKDIFPQYSEKAKKSKTKKEPVDERWAPLKNFKFN